MDHRSTLGQPREQLGDSQELNLEGRRVGNKADKGRGGKEVTRTHSEQLVGGREGRWGKRAYIESKMVWTTLTLTPGRGLEAQGTLGRGKWGSGSTRRDRHVLGEPAGRVGGRETFLTHTAFLKGKPLSFSSSVFSSAQRLRAVWPCPRKGVHVSLDGDARHPKMPTGHYAHAPA